MSQIYRARAPLRLGLAGGGTDVSPFSEDQGGFVLNATIDLYAHAILEPLNNGRIVFAAEDREERIEFCNVYPLPDADPLRLHRAIYNYMVRCFNGGNPLSFSLTTFADAPAGSGLGTSSTMVVCMIQAFSEWLRLGMGEYEIASLAYEIERREVMMSGGKQDQYAAAFGGFNFIEFGPGPDRVLVNPLRIKDWFLNELEASTVLFFTGQSRESSNIIQQQVRSMEMKHAPAVNAMVALKQDAVSMKEAILRGDLARYAVILRDSWETKKQLSTSVTNPHLDAIYDEAMKAGALAGKITGAGGGGFFMFFVPPKKRMGLIRQLQNWEGQVINFHFTGIGSQSWVQND
jgi:D-glycero-alpha-D-manno-heptose-7-phosphate kinase